MNAHDSFIAAMLPTARRFQAKYGFAAEGLVAINISETNYGAAGSFFGIKGSGNAGSIDYSTWENYGPGQEHTIINDQFAAYKSLDDAYQAFFDFIQIGRYIPAWQRFEADHDWRELVHAINVAGYASDPRWATFIIALSKDVKNSPAWHIGADMPDEQRIWLYGNEQAGAEVRGQQIFYWHNGVEIRAEGDFEGTLPGQNWRHAGDDADGKPIWVKEWD